MNKKYITLFRELAQATAILAEQVMEYNQKQNDEKGYETAKKMRDDYQELTGIIANAGDEYTPTQAEVARLLVGAMVQVNNLNTRIEALKKAMRGYQTDVVPKLQEIMDLAKDDNEAQKIANEKFVITDDN